ncbi:hypothetical protein AB0H28_07610 [Micromonospora sp. NPDC050980]|uniref:hypothetical protein n=1 Tax=Micromonospora sp. NPDC050980 TaxID=3155161 RepID=UPI0033D18E2C
MLAWSEPGYHRALARRPLFAVDRVIAGWLAVTSTGHRVIILAIAPAATLIVGVALLLR